MLHWQKKYRCMFVVKAVRTTSILNNVTKTHAHVVQTFNVAIVTINLHSAGHFYAFISQRRCIFKASHAIAFLNMDVFDSHLILFFITAKHIVTLIR